MTRLSLRVRLALGGFLALAVALGIAWLGLTWLFERHAYRVLADNLDEIARQIIGGLEFDASGAAALPQPPRDPRFDAPLSGLYWEVIGASRPLRSRSLWDAALTLPDDALGDGQTHYHQITGPEGKLLLVAERRIAPVATRGERLRVIVASDLTRLRVARDAFAADLAPSLALLSLVLAACAWIQLSLGLRPLASLRDEVAAVATGERSRLSESAPLEVRPLVAEVNALLDARDAETERARGRAADLAHGLKTPLAALAGDARRLRADGQVEVARSIEAVGETMRRHVERELARARTRGRTPARGADAAPIAEVVEALFGILRRTEKGGAIAFVNNAPRAARAPIERSDLIEVLGNVLDNAVRYARTTVRVSCQGDSEPLAIVVEDDGPGIEPNMEALIRQRGGRLDESGGAGLGLSLVQDILDANHWRMGFERSPLGGLSLRLAPHR